MPTSLNPIPAWSEWDCQYQADRVSWVSDAYTNGTINSWVTFIRRTLYHTPIILINHLFAMLTLQSTPCKVINCCDCVTLRTDDLPTHSWCSCGFSYFHQISVKRLCVTLDILPSLSMLSHTLTKTWNFCSLVSVSAPSQFFITLSIWRLDVIIFCSESVLQ